jgi:hypothetical protein
MIPWIATEQPVSVTVQIVARRQVCSVTISSSIHNNPRSPVSLRIALSAIPSSTEPGNQPGKAGFCSGSRIIRPSSKTDRGLRTANHPRSINARDTGSTHPSLGSRPAITHATMAATISQSMQVETISIVQSKVPPYNHGVTTSNARAALRTRLRGYFFMQLAGTGGGVVCRGTPLSR